MPLHTTYRPKSFDDMAGNNAMLASLESTINRKEDPQTTYLFTGPAGCGKTTLAKILKDKFKCSEWDFREYNGANTRGVDTIREVITDMKNAPMDGKVKIYFFDECHMLTPQAQEAFLKDTEQPPKHVFFIFCTTEPEKLKDTFLSRCFHGEVRKLMRGEMNRLITKILDKEQVELPKPITSKLIKVSEGCPRQALKLLDSVIDMTDDKQIIEALDISTGYEANMLDICRLLVDNTLSFEKKWPVVQRHIVNLKAEPETSRRSVLTYMEKVMLGKNASRHVVSIIAIFEQSVIYSFRAGFIAQCYLACELGG